MNLKNNKVKIILGVFVLLIISFLAYRFVSANQGDNKVAVRNANITAIKTGTASFNESDNLQDNNGTLTYTAGMDSSDNNRIVRAFDSITYDFTIQLEGKENNDNIYENRKVNIKVVLPEDVLKYVKVQDCENMVCEFSDMDVLDNYSVSVTLNVLGAPNGTQINPTFEIQESTNTEDNYIVKLGKVNDKNYYGYSRDNSTYYDKSNVPGFTNYMPTIVSSKRLTSSNVKFDLLSQTTAGQKTTYNNVNGRYLTYVLGVKLVGENGSIKGYEMPDNTKPIEFDFSVNNGIFDPSWIRLYSDKNLGDIEPVMVSLPYSDSIQTDRTIQHPGSVSASSTGPYKVSISGYEFPYNQVKVSADNSEINSNDYYIGTYAISIFSPLSDSDITTSLQLSNSALVYDENNKVEISSVVGYIENKFYEEVDYSLTSAFYKNGSRLSTNGNGMGSTSKGSTISYRTEFSYKKTLSNQGLKEIIKIDSDAFRVMDNVEITVLESDKIKSDDFEIKYLSGDYSNLNYSLNSTYDRLSEKNISCSNNISTLTKDQMMNLYGGPCIKGNDNVETSYDNVSDAFVKQGDNNVEVPITKIIVQTKKGVVLPDSVKVMVEVKLRVRNVSDITKTYQVVSVASSSDYDSTLTYYSPRITNDENSITNPNNYRKTIYKGSTIDLIDDNSPWGDSLKIVNFTSRQDITVENKNADGSVKTNYSVNNNEIIKFNIKTTIEDESEVVGADDVWYINHLKVYVTIPPQLVYVPDSSLGNPEITIVDGNTCLIYNLPYTRPNMKIDDINFKAQVNPSISGDTQQAVVGSMAYAVNINNEVDTSYIGELVGSFILTVEGRNNIILSQTAENNTTVVDKNTQFSYLLGGYNNTSQNIDDYTIVDILPSNNDVNGSQISGTYQVKVTLPASLSQAKVTCSTQEISKLSNDPLDTRNEFNSCDAVNNFVSATAIRIDNISINAGSNMDNIKVTIKPNNNNYSDKYINSFTGGSKTLAKSESNKTEVRVISRNISGKVFLDVNENGIKDETDKSISDIPVTIYKLDSENNIERVTDTVTNKNGEYIFKDLDKGRYKVRLNYSNDDYDLTLRYATEDSKFDSDAYKIEEGLSEISNKKVVDGYEGLWLRNDIESISDMDMGLISKKAFNLDIKKYITKVDLTYNNALEVHEYNNLSIVKEDVRNSLNASARVYYGIEITNNSNNAGYVKIVNENIPTGMTFDSSNEYNEGWYAVNGEIQNTSLENDLIGPGEKRYLKIVLNMPPQREFRSFINTVTLLKVEEYVPESISEDATTDYDKYKIGEALTFAGVDWHVINAVDSNGDQILTLLADSKDSAVNKMKHTENANDTYKWSTSKINKYLNSNYFDDTSLNASALIDSYICDDASGLQQASYGGTLQSEGTCQSKIYVSSKVRLLTMKEFESLRDSNIEDLTWLFGKRDFWTMNSSYIVPTYDDYGKQTNAVNNQAVYADFKNRTSKNGNASTEKEVRPVITISSRNIIPE